MVTQPDRCLVLGGTWRTPVGVGLQSKTFITKKKNNDLEKSYALPMYKMSPEYNSLQFVNLRDDAKINQICSMDVFVNNPIDLTQL